VKHILFVDDEPRVLRGIERGLARQRAAWTMVFAPDAHAGLDALGLARFDVVVSDLRMPGMDGAAFLAVVADRYPGVGRIVLSGSTEGIVLARAIDVAHAILGKPCPTAELRACIEHRLASAEPRPTSE
jgi:DNA-binding NarL/FixJ family response regulator